MKPLYAVVFSLFLLFASCGNSGKSNKSYVPSSVGNINALQIVVSNELWNGPVGDAIRENYAAAADGLPQDEPLFSMSQMAIESFVDFARTNRIFLYVQLDEEETVGLVKNKYAKPQTGGIIRANSEERLIELIHANSPQFIEAFHQSEIKERQRRTRISKRDVDSLKKTLGVSIEIPSAYRLAGADSNHFWYRKDLKEGEMNVLIYQVPMDMITGDSTAVVDIIKIRDSIGSTFIPVEDEDKMVTEQAYAPFIFKTHIDEHPAYLTKGIWELANYHMAGPFLNYAVKDEKNSRYLILEGFVYAPMVRKRNLQFELESILVSAKIE